MIASFAKKLFAHSGGAVDARLRKARLIACDLDGTLLNGDEMVGVGASVGIRAIESLGIPFVFITRRHHQAAEPYAELLKMTTPIISLDGSMISSPSTDVPLFLIEPDQGFARDILDETLSRPGADFCAVTPSRFYLSRPDLHLPSQHQHWNIDVRHARDVDDVEGEILEIFVIGSLHAVNAVLRYVETKMRKNELAMRVYESRSKRDTWFLEIRPANAGKHIALQHLADDYGIAMKEVIGIGDYQNDLEFCRRSGYVVAMRNAVSELKKIADYVTSRTCLDDGVEEFLELFLQARGFELQKGSDREENEVRTRRARSR